MAGGIFVWSAVRWFDMHCTLLHTDMRVTLLGFVSDGDSGRGLGIGFCDRGRLNQRNTGA